MFCIEFFCGRRYGGWIPGSARFASREEARAVMLADTLRELVRGVTPMARRVAQS